MTDDELSKCKKIIHGHAAAAAAGNLVPIPGVGLAADTVTMTTMAMPNQMTRLRMTPHPVEFEMYYSL